jgi:hypothetical protein
MFSFPEALDSASDNPDQVRLSEVSLALTTTSQRSTAKTYATEAGQFSTCP